MIDPTKPEDAEALRRELVKVFPDAARYLYPVANFARNCWLAADEWGCWLAHAQMAWTNDSWGWQSVEPNATQKRVMTCRPCALGGWFLYDVASIGD